MSDYIAFSPVDWPLFERLGLHADASGAPEALGRLLAAETYWSDAGDRRFLAAIADNATIAASAWPTMIATRADPQANAARAARFLAGQEERARDRCRAELARSDVDCPFLYDDGLLLACHSRAYAGYLFGEGELVDGRVAYDGPEWLATALGGPRDPRASCFALLPPDEVARLARAMEGHDPRAVLAKTDPEVRDFHHDSFGDESSLEVFLEEAIELLGIIYDDAASLGHGFHVHMA